MQCPQHIFTNMFNTWLIQAGKVDINKVPTKTLEGLAYQGVIKKKITTLLKIEESLGP